MLLFYIFSIFGLIGSALEASTGLTGECTYSLDLLAQRVQERVASLRNGHGFSSLIELSDGRKLRIQASPTLRSHQDPENPVYSLSFWTTGENGIWQGGGFNYLNSNSDLLKISSSFQEAISKLTNFERSNGAKSIHFEVVPDENFLVQDKEFYYRPKRVQFIWEPHDGFFGFRKTTNDDKILRDLRKKFPSEIFGLEVLNDGKHKLQVRTQSPEALQEIHDYLSNGAHTGEIEIWHTPKEKPRVEQRTNLAQITHSMVQNTITHQEAGTKRSLFYMGSIKRSLQQSLQEGSISSHDTIDIYYPGELEARLKNHHKISKNESVQFHPINTESPERNRVAFQRFPKNPEDIWPRIQLSIRFDVKDSPDTQQIRF